MKKNGENGNPESGIAPTKNYVAFFTGLFISLTGIPAGIYLGFILVPSGSLSGLLRYSLHIFAFMTSYPLFILALSWLNRSPVRALLLISSGMVFRIFGLFMVGIILMLKYQAYLREGILIYFISIATFLIFELVSVGWNFFHAFKR